MTRSSIILCVLTVALLVGCEMPFGTGPGDEDKRPGHEVRDEVQIEPGLTARLYAPEQVAAGDSFQVRFIAENTTSSAIQLQTGACWGQPAAFFGGEQVPLVGSLQICTMQLLTWTLPGKDTRERTFDMKATLKASIGSPEEVGPAEPGSYTLETVLDWRVGGQKVEKALEAPVTITGRR